MEKLTEILKQAFFKNKTGKELLLCKRGPERLRGICIDKK